MKERYTLVRVYKKNLLIAVEEIKCKTLKEAVDLGTCLSDEERYLGSHIIDEVGHKRLTLKGEK